MTVWEIVVEGRQGEDDMLNVFHYEVLGAVEPDFTLVAADFRGHLQDHIAPLANPTTSWVGITVREDAPGAVGTFVAFPGGILVGTQPAGDQMNVSAALIKKFSGGLIRPTQGWWFQGGITVGGLSPTGTWEAGPSAALAAYAEAIREISIAGPATLSMVIKARNPTAPNTQPYSTVATVAVAGRPRTLRSRFTGRGS